MRVLLLHARPERAPERGLDLLGEPAGRAAAVHVNASRAQQSAAHGLGQPRHVGEIRRCGVGRGGRTQHGGDVLVDGEEALERRLASERSSTQWSSDANMNMNGRIQ